MAVGNKAEGGRDGENQACKRPGRARDGAQQDRAEAKAGVDFEATREGEETPELDLRDRADIEATRCITPVTTKEEENPGREGDTKEDEGSREEEEARYQSDQVPQDSHIQAELHRDEARNGTEQGRTTVLHRDKATDEAIEPEERGELRDYTKARLKEVYEEELDVLHVLCNEEDEARYQSALSPRHQDENYKNYIQVERGKPREDTKARLKVFDEEELDVPFVLFNEVLVHGLRIDRIYRQPQGHLPPIGVSGGDKTTPPRFGAKDFSGDSAKDHSVDSARDLSADSAKDLAVDAAKDLYVDAAKALAVNFANALVVDCAKDRPVDSAKILSDGSAKDHAVSQLQKTQAVKSAELETKNKEANEKLKQKEKDQQEAEKQTQQSIETSQQVDLAVDTAKALSVDFAKDHSANSAEDHSADSAKDLAVDSAKDRSVDSAKALSVDSAKDLSGHLIQDGATDASIDTLEQQEQQDNLDILEDLTTMDKLHRALTEHCFANNHCATIRVREAGDTAGKGPGKGGSWQGKGTS